MNNKRRSDKNRPNPLYYQPNTTYQMSSIDPETPAVETPKSSVEEPVLEETNIVKDEEASVNAAKLREEFQEKARTYLAEQAQHIIIPSFAKWFDLSKIHSIEEKLFPDFFVDATPKSTYKCDQVYKNMRDFMVNAYRLNPREYLTVTAVRRNLAGDVTSIIRIHQFLERWGLINYQIDPRTKSSIVGPQYTGHFQVTLDTPSGLLPFVPEDATIVDDKQASLPSPAPSASDDAEIPSKQDNHLSLNLELRRNVYTTSNNKFAPKNTSLVQYFCNICGKEATNVRYHNLRIKSYTHNPSSTINNASILCSICYDQGLFPLNFQSSDFVKLQKNQDLAEWSEQEVLLLLEGIEMFGTYDVPNMNGGVNVNVNGNGQWDKISEHVGTKTREQCLLKFIQLPIEDKFLSKLIEGENVKSEENGPSNETLVTDIVKKIISEQSGKDLVKNNAQQKKAEAVQEQSNLINQIIGLTLEKFEQKLKKVDTLQESLLKVESQLNLERIQVLIERWVQFEKLQKLKQERPELADILDDLITPVKVNEINKSLNPVNSDKVSDKMEIDDDKSKQNDLDKLPVSVSKPKSYQYWSG